MFGRNRSEPVEVQTMRQGMRRAGRRMAVHNAIAPLRPNQINPATGRTNRDTAQLDRQRRSGS